MPPPEACPPGAVEAMKKLGILGDRGSIDFGGDKPVSVQEGPFSVRVAGNWRVGEDYMGRGGQIAIPTNTMLSGRLYFGEKRVYGRITEARPPNQEPFPVCMELFEGSLYRGERGLEPMSMEGNTAKVWPVGWSAGPVERFE
jgi:serine/threonine-protein kinase